MKNYIFFLMIIVLSLFGCSSRTGFQLEKNPSASGNFSADNPSVPLEPHPLQIEVMREKSYPGSPITIEDRLNPGLEYNRYLVLYISEGYKIFALMTVPFGNPPDSGWPVIIFNHGYIHPPHYSTDDNYVNYMDMLARSGYIVFKSDYRGHANSEGPIVGGGYGSPGFTTDVLNALESLKDYEGVNPDRIGMWGHSMGGQVTLRAMVVSDEIKAGVIWGGVVVPYPEIISLWNISEEERSADFSPSVMKPDGDRTDDEVQTWWDSFGGWVESFTEKYGKPEQNPEFWESISPNTYITDLSGPLQIQHGVDDKTVPLAWAEVLVQDLQDAGMPYEFYTYEGDDHNLSNNFRDAIQQTIAFFDQYLKDD
jgi:uncharacterized protein